MYSLLNILSEYTYFYISKNITFTLLLLVFKIVESLSVSLKDYQILMKKEKKNQKVLLLIGYKGDFMIIRNLVYNIIAINSNKIITMIFESKYCTDQNIVQFVNFSSNGKLDCEFVSGDIIQSSRYSLVIITR